MQMINRIFILTIVFSTVFVGSTSSQCVITPPSKISIGGILNKVSDASRDRPFNDVFKTNRGFASNPSNPLNSGLATTDSVGWPTQDFSVVVMTAMTPELGGTYRLRFNGKADIASFSSNFKIQNNQYDTPSNTTTADLVYPDTVQSSENLALSFTHTKYDSVTNGVKNIVILKPKGSLFGTPFSTTFTSQLNRFEVLNFVQWRSVYTATDSSWSNRTQVTSPSQAGNKGVAWEYCIQLANTLNKDIWIHLPHKSDTDYAKNLAILLKSSLNKNLNVYVEYTSEIDNFSYLPAQWNTQQADFEGAQPNCPFNPDHTTDRFTLNIRRYAYKTKQIYDAFKGVFGDSEMNNRIRVIYGGQIDWLDFSQRGLDFIQKTYGDPKNYIYAVSIIPYLQVNQVDINKPNTALPADIINGLQNNLNQLFSPDSVLINQWASRAAYYGLKLFGTGGINTAGDINISAKAAASRLAPMKDLTSAYLTKWYAYNPAGLLNWNAAGADVWDTNAGTFPITENFENSYKLQGLDSALLMQPPTLSVGQSILQPVDARKIATIQYGTTGKDYYQPGIEPFIEYLLRVPAGASGSYQIRLVGRSQALLQYVNVYLDNHFLARLQVPNTGSLTGPFKSSDSLTYKGMGEGLHSLRLQWISTEFQLNTITFTKVGDCVNISPTEETTISTSIKVYPNPASDFVTIESLNVNTIPQRIQFTDLLGRVILDRTFVETAELDISKWSRGIYLYTVFENNRRIHSGKLLTSGGQ